MKTSTIKSTHLITPYGGKLINLIAEDEEHDRLLLHAKNLPSIQISARSVCDLELLATGAFSPLDRFMGEHDYRSVLKDMRMADGTLMPIPITLPIESVDDLKIGSEVALRSLTNEILAVMFIEEIFTWDRNAECLAVLGTTDSRHPLVSEMHRWGKYLVSGPLKVVNLPRHYDFQHIRRKPIEVRMILEELGRADVVAYQPRHPMHRAQESMTKAAAAEVGGTLLIQPVVGITEHNDSEHYARVRCYEALIESYYDAGQVLINLMPLATRMAGPRAGLWHGIINRNYGANYFIIGRDPHSPGKDTLGEAFYTSRDVQELFRAHENEVGVNMIPHREMVYLPGDNQYEDSGCVTHNGKKYIRVSSAAEIEDSLFMGKRLPEWYTYPEIAQILFDAYPPKTRQGFCIWLTGLPCSGKSTIADILITLLRSSGRRVTVLDGDVVRTHLTKGLGFSKEDRITNILRVAFVAAEIVRHDGVVVCALISPYASARDQARSMIGSDKFFEVFVDTPVSICEERDVKGMYAMARQGKIKGFTGVDDIYEPPRCPELTVSTVSAGPEANARKILELLVERGFLKFVEKRAKQRPLRTDAVQAARS